MPERLTLLAMSGYKIWLSPPHMSGDELKLVQDAFVSNWIAPVGPHIDAFENELAHYLGEDVKVAAVSSGTAAIHLALNILDVIPGDEVICPTFTFVATCNPIRYLGATPVFIDSELETWNMDPKLLKQAIIDRVEKTGKKPKAIILVDLYGMPAKLNELLAIAKEFGIPVIEDAADALGAEYLGRKCGTFGDIGIISFNGNKIITTSGGGAVVSQHKEYIEKAKYLAAQAKDSNNPYEHSRVGYNYRLSNVSAAIGRAQLMVIQQRIKARRFINESYSQALREKSFYYFLPEPPGAFSNRWLTTMLINPNELGITLDYIRKKLGSEGIESRLLWKPMHLQPVFKDSPAYLNNCSESIFNKGICLPSGSSLTAEQLKEIIAHLI